MTKREMNPQIQQNYNDYLNITNELTKKKKFSWTNDGRERLSIMTAELLIKEECQYCVTRKELLAVVNCNTNFRPYLLV